MNRTTLKATGKVHKNTDLFLTVWTFVFVSFSIADKV